MEVEMSSKAHNRNVKMLKHVLILNKYSKKARGVSYMYSSDTYLRVTDTQFPLQTTRGKYLVLNVLRESIFSRAACTAFSKGAHHCTSLTQLQYYIA